MKKLIIAAVLSLSVLPVLPVLASASTEINPSHQGELLKVGSISASGGNLDELSKKLSIEAKNAGADYFRITYLNTKNRGYASATLYNKADV